MFDGIFEYFHVVALKKPWTHLVSGHPLTFSWRCILHGQLPLRECPLAQGYKITMLMPSSPLKKNQVGSRQCQVAFLVLYGTIHLCGQKNIGTTPWDLHYHAKNPQLKGQ